MKYRLLAYRDLKLNAYATPFIMPVQFDDATITEQVRRNIIAGGNETIVKYRDFDLYDLGLYDDDYGIVTPNQPTLICKCGELKGVIQEDA